MITGWTAKETIDILVEDIIVSIFYIFDSSFVKSFQHCYIQSCFLMDL